MTKFLIIRHGSTELNEGEDAIRGWLEVALSAQGREEVTRLAEALEGQPLDGLITSDLLRAIETTEILEKHFSVLGITLALRPWNVGRFTCVPSADCNAELGRYARERPEVSIDGGESFATFKRRLLHGMQMLNETFSDQYIGLVTHHRCERVLDAWDVLGQPASLEIDFPTFLQKGVAPGAFWVLEMKE